MDEREKRQLREGAGDAFSSAFEMIVTPALFGLLGWWIDSRLGLFPIVTLALVAVTLTYEVWKLVSRYGDEMDRALDERRAGYGREGAA